MGHNTPEIWLLCKVWTNWTRDDQEVYSMIPYTTTPDDGPVWLCWMQVGNVHSSWWNQTWIWPSWCCIQNRFIWKDVMPIPYPGSSLITSLEVLLFVMSSQKPWSPCWQLNCLSWQLLSCKQLFLTQHSWCGCMIPCSCTDNMFVFVAVSDWGGHWDSAWLSIWLSWTHQFHILLTIMRSRWTEASILQYNKLKSR